MEPTACRSKPGFNTSSTAPGSIILLFEDVHRRTLSLSPLAQVLRDRETIGCEFEREFDWVKWRRFSAQTTAANVTDRRECLLTWSGRRDSNSRPHAPQACALPGCATSRLLLFSTSDDEQCQTEQKERCQSWHCLMPIVDFRIQGSPLNRHPQLRAKRQSLIDNRR